MSRLNNRYDLTGNLAADPVVRNNTNTGEIVAVEFQLAVDGSYKKADGTLVEAVDYIKQTVYGERTRENVLKILRKGSRVRCAGVISKRTWDSKTRFEEDGTTPKKDSGYEFKLSQFQNFTPKPSAPDQVDSDTYGDEETSM